MSVAGQRGRRRGGDERDDRDRLRVLSGPPRGPSGSHRGPEARMSATLTRAFSAVVIALRAVRRNKLRAGLTILGITIGVAAVVTVTALASGARANVNAARSRTSAPTRSSSSPAPPAPRASGTCWRQALGARWPGARARVDEHPRSWRRSSGRAPRSSTKARTRARRSSGRALNYFEIRSWKVAQGEPWSPASENLSRRSS